jgi:hypothetical protein
MLDPDEEKYYRNAINDFGLGHPKYSHTYFVTATSGQHTFGLPFTPVGYTTVRVNNLVLEPDVDYFVTGSFLEITPPLNAFDVVIVVAETA